MAFFNSAVDVLQTLVAVSYTHLAVELAFRGAYAFLLHCPDGCALMDGGKTVSYTHLDVYKRQIELWA